MFFASYIISLLHQITINSAVHLYKYTKNVNTTYQITIFYYFITYLKQTQICKITRKLNMQNIFSKYVQGSESTWWGLLDRNQYCRAL